MDKAFNWLTPDDTALIVIDKQGSYMGNDDIISWAFKNANNNFDRLVSDIDNFIERAHRKNIPIVWTRMVESPDPEVSPANISKKLINDQTKSISDSSMAGFDFVGDKPQAGDKVITKRFYDAFAQTGLDDYLQTLNVNNVVLVGGFTSRCVLGTAYGANGHGYNVVIASNLVGNAANFQDENEPALKIINSILGYTVDSSQIPW